MPLANAGANINSTDQIADSVIVNADVSPTAAIDESKISGAVDKTSAENVGGVKTFTADPIVPAEAFGAGWDGSNEIPTKNDVYDRVNSGAAAPDVQLFTTPGANTWTRPAGAKIVLMELIAGGGNGPNTGTYGASGGGGGGFLPKEILAGLLTPTVTVTVGAANQDTTFGSYGTAVKGANGTSGSSAAGGAGGVTSGGVNGGNGGACNSYTAGGSGGGGGGAAGGNGGDVVDNTGGAAGTVGTACDLLGAGGRGEDNSGLNGADGVNYGGGGGGGGGNGGTGHAGAQGVARITTYF